MKRLYPTQPLVGVGIVILDGDRMLLEKRKNEPGKGKWSIPGGLVEVGETIEQTAVREVSEETGLKVGEPVFIDVVDSIIRDAKNYVKYHFVIIDCLMKLEGGLLKAASDADELRWVSLGEVEKYDLTSSFRSFFGRNKRRLKTLA